MTGFPSLGLSARSRGALAAYLSLWALSTAYLALRGADWVFPVISLLLFGGVLSGLALVTARPQAPAVPVERPATEAKALLLYLLVFAFVFFGPLYTWFQTAIPEGRPGEIIVLGYKIVVHILLPLLLLWALRVRVRGVTEAAFARPGVARTFVTFTIILFGLLAVVSPSLDQIGALGLTPAVAFAWVLGSWAWVSLEAGLCEEFLFRALLQSRLTAWFGSAPAAIVTAALLFSLVHVPGLYLRGNAEVDGWSTDLFQVMAFAMATLSPLAILLGTIWHRTRSLWLVVLLHGAIDALPATASFFRTWGG